MKRAYSYLRFSSGAQAKGDSKRRQMEKAAKWTQDNGYFLDTTLSFQDLGVSAFSGDNVTHGRLGAFIQLVEDGVIPKGSVLIVESLDRISRQEISEALELFLRIIRLEIDIVTLIPDPVRFSKSTLDMGQIMYAIVVLSRANDESVHKSDRGNEKWNERRKLMQKGQPVGNICPRWLRCSEDRKRFLKVPEKVRVVKRIFELCLEGEGTHAIAETLNNEKQPVLGHGKRWSSGQVRHVLVNRQVVGFRQLRQKIDGKLVPVGEPIPNYFPKVIDEEKFFRAQQFLKKNKTGKPGPRGKYITNLFTNLIVSHRLVGEKLEETAWTIHGTKNHVTLRGPRPEQVGRKKRFHLPYAALEKALLRNLYELNVKDLLQGGAKAHQQLEAARGELEAVKQNLAETTKGLRKRYSDTLARIAQDLESQQKALEKRIDELIIETKNSASDTLKDLQDLILRLERTTGEALKKLRVSLKARIRQAVDKVLVGHIEEISNQNRTVTFLISFRHYPRIRYVEINFRTNGYTKKTETTVRTQYLDTEKRAWSKVRKG